MHWLAALLHLTQAGYSFGLAPKSKNNFQITQSFNRPGKNETKSVASFNMAYLVGIFPLLSSANHIWSTLDKARYQGFVAEGYNPVRYAEYALSATIMFWVISILSGLNDIGVLLSQAVLNIALQYVGYLVEREKRYDLLYLGFLLFAGIWIPILISFFSTPDAPPSVNAIIASMTVLMLSFGVLSACYLRFNWDFGKVERGYLVLSLLAKTLLTNLTLFGVLFST